MARKLWRAIWISTVYYSIDYAFQYANIVFENNTTHNPTRWFSFVLQLSQRMQARLVLLWTMMLCSLWIKWYLLWRNSCSGRERVGSQLRSRVWHRGWLAALLHTREYISCLRARSRKIWCRAPHLAICM